MSESAPSVAAVFVFGVALAGCAPRELSWELVLASPELRPRVVRVRTAVLRGGCRGEAVYTADFAPGAEAPRPPALEDGTWGFAGTAFDDACAAIAAGCVEARLPTAAVSVPLLTVASPMAECARAQCQEGSCVGVTGSCTGCPPILCRAGRCQELCGTDGFCPEPTLCCPADLDVCCPFSCPADPLDDPTCIDPVMVF